MCICNRVWEKKSKKYKRGLLSVWFWGMVSGLSLPSICSFISVFCAVYAHNSYIIYADIISAAALWVLISFEGVGILCAAPDLTGLWKEDMNQMSIDLLANICTIALAVVQIVHIICEWYSQKNKRRWWDFISSSFFWWKGLCSLVS